MKHFIIAAVLLLSAVRLVAQASEQYPGTFSLGTRNTVSLFNDDDIVGKGIGGQFRLQFFDRMNTEWYLDYITSKDQRTFRNDYHIGWSVMIYSRDNFDFTRLIQPYLIMGHCFDYSKVMEQNNRSNFADRLSMAAQAGLGSHINITDELDCSLSAQYMIHFGKGIETNIANEKVIIQRKEFTHPHGHFLLTVNFNYKFFQLW